MELGLVSVNMWENKAYFKPIKYKDDSVELSFVLSLENIDWFYLYKNQFKAKKIKISDLFFKSIKKQSIKADDFLDKIRAIDFDSLIVEAQTVSNPRFSASNVQFRASKNLDEYQKFIFADNFQLSVSYFEADSGIKVRGIYLNTLKDTLFVNSLMNEFLNLKEISFSNIDFEKLILKRSLFCDSLFFKSSVHIGSTRAVYRNFPLDSIWIGKILVDSFCFHSPKLQLTDAKFYITELSLNKKSIDLHPIDWIKDVSGLVESLSFDDKAIGNIHHLSILGLRKGFMMNQFSLKSKSKKILDYDVYASEVQFLGFDSKSLIKENKFILQNLRIESPDAKFWRLKGQDTLTLGLKEIENIALDYFKIVQIERVQINNARLHSYRVRLDTSLLLGLQNFNFFGKRFQIYKSSYQDAEKLFFFSEIDFSLNNLFVRHTDSVHVFQLKNIRYIRDEIEIENLGFFPTFFNPQIKQYDIRVPKFTVKGFDIKKLIHDKSFLVDTMLLAGVDADFLNQSAGVKIKFPKIDSIYRRFVVEADSNEKNLFDYLNKFHISYIRFAQSKISYYSDDTDSATAIILPDLEVVLEDMDLDSIKLLEKKLVFNAKKGFAKTKNVAYKDKNIHILIREMDIFPGDSALRLHKVFVSSKKYDKITVRNLNLSGIDYSKFFSDSLIKIRQAYIVDSDFDWTLEDSRGMKPPLPFKFIDISSIRFQKAKVRLKWGNNQLCALDTDIKIDSLRKNDSNLNFTHGYIRSKRWEFEFPDTKMGGDSLYFNQYTGLVKVNKPYLKSQNFSFYANKIYLNGFLFDSLGAKKLLADSLYVLNPEFSSNRLQKAVVPKFYDFYSFISPSLLMVSLKQISMKNGMITWRDTVFHSFRGLNLDVKDLLIKENEPQRLLDSRQFSIWGKDYEIEIPHISSKLKLINWSYRSLDSTCKVQQARLEPEYESEVYPFLSQNDNRIEIKAENIALRRFSPQKWLQEGTVIAKRFEIGDLKATIYSDEIKRRSLVRKPLLQEIILNIRPKFKLDTFWVRSGKIRYEKMFFLTDSIGFVEFEDTRLEAYQVDNISPNIVTFQLSGFLQGEGYTEVAVVMDLQDTLFKHFVGGKISFISPESFNSILTPGLSFKIKEKALCSEVNFDFTANKNHSFGQLTAIYDKLHIQRIDPKKNKVRADDAMFNLLANTILKNKNPRFLFIRQGRIYFQRDTSRSFVSYWVRSLLEGVKTSVGMPSKYKPPLSVQLFFKEIKENRLRRSELRKRARKK